MNGLASLSTMQSALRASDFTLLILPLFPAESCAVGTLWELWSFLLNQKDHNAGTSLPKSPTSKPHLAHLRGSDLESCLSFPGLF